MNDFSNKKENNNDRKIFIIVLCIVVAVCSAYAVRALYYSRTGKITTQTISRVTQGIYIEADGIALRDEGSGKSNKSVLKKSSDGVYAPNVADGESVAKNECIAYAFSSSEQVSSYNKSKELRKRIDMLEKLQDSGNLSKLNAEAIASNISSDLSEYIASCDSNDLSAAGDLVDSMVYKITSTQIISGKELDFSAEIKKLKAQYASLNADVSNAEKVLSPCAGYYVNGIDGYEGLLDYTKAQETGFTADELKNMMKQKADIDPDAFGKIISEHAWYFVCNTPYSHSLKIKEGDTVNVSFESRGIKNLSMTVHKLNRNGKTLCITLRCMTMNDGLLDLRKEKAKIEIDSYEGFKINTAALKNYTQEHMMGVYVVSGSYASLKPIEVIYSGEDYVIAREITKYTVTDEKTNKSEEVELQSDKVLKEYDRVIVKGKNLYDGKVLD